MAFLLASNDFSNWRFFPFEFFFFIFLTLSARVCVSVYLCHMKIIQTFSWKYGFVWVHCLCKWVVLCQFSNNKWGKTKWNYSFLSSITNKFWLKKQLNNCLCLLCWVCPIKMWRHNDKNVGLRHDSIHGRVKEQTTTKRKNNLFVFKQLNNSFKLATAWIVKI